MMAILITALLLPVLVFATQWIMSDFFEQPKTKSRQYGKIQLLPWLIYIGIVSVFAIQVRNFLSGRYQLIFGEITLVVIVISFGLSFQTFIAKRRLRLFHERLEVELPELVAMFTILISAGESVTNSIHYLSKFTRSESANIFRSIEQLHKEGKSITQALDIASEATHSRAFRKFTDAIALSIARGSPLSATLMNQTSEARSLYKSHILETAGKAEIKLMIPVVFLILPISIVFALFPSLQALNRVM